MGFVPSSEFRIELNFFQDFFWTSENFTQWIKEDFLDKETPISDIFITNFYYAFLREYRNQIVVEQENFIQDLTMAFVNHKRHFELLYSLWITANDDPFQMIRNNHYEQRDYHRNDHNEEERKNQNISDLNKMDLQNSNDSTKTQSENQSSGSDNTQTKSKTLERELENQGQIQAKLALNDLIVANDKDLDNVEHYSTNASINKNERNDNTLNLTGNKSKNNVTNDNVNTTKNKSNSKQIDNQIGKNKSNSQINSRDFNKSFDQNKADLIKKFTNSDLTEGFQEFVRAKDFRSLFGRMNAGMYSWYGYTETRWDDIPLQDVPDNEISLTEILVNTKIGFVEQIDAPTITKQIIYVNPGITNDDFFVSNIYPDKLSAYVVGKGHYNGFLQVTYVTTASVKGGKNV